MPGPSRIGRPGPSGHGSGPLARRGFPLLVLDAGNAFIGAQSLESRGEIILSAYNVLGYDAVNLAHRDFWLGKADTLTLLKGAKFAVLSATCSTR